MGKADLDMEGERLGKSEGLMKTNKLCYVLVPIPQNEYKLHVLKCVLIK